jgi:DNA modification methylase
MPALVDGPVTVHLGDALEVLRELPDESVHCVLTSPPYWGLERKRSLVDTASLPSGGPPGGAG